MEEPYIPAIVTQHGDTQDGLKTHRTGPDSPELRNSPAGKMKLLTEQPLGSPCTLVAAACSLHIIRG